MNGIRTKLLKGSLSQLLTLVISVLITIFLTPFIISHIGDEMFGLWALVGGFMGATGLLDFGLSAALKRYFPLHYAKNELEKVNEVFWSSLMIFAIIGGVILIGILCCTEILYSYFSSEISYKVFRLVFIILAIDLSVHFPMRTLFGYFESHLRYELLSGIECLKNIVRSIFIYYSLTFGCGIVSIALITIIVNLVGYLILLCIFLKFYRDIHFKAKFIRIGQLKRLYKYSSISFIAALGDMLRFKVDSFVIAKFIGISMVTFYFIGSKLSMYFIEIISAILGLTVPVFSRMAGKGEDASIKYFYFLLIKIATILSFYIGGMLIILGDSFIIRWMGVGYSVSYEVMVVITTGLIIALSQTPTINLLRGTSTHFILMICNLGEGVVNLILSVFLVKKFGIIGVAYGTAIPMILTKLFVQPILTTIYIPYIGFSEYFLKTYLPIMAKSAFLMLLMYYVLHPLVLPDYYRLFLLVLLSTLYFPIIYKIAFTNDEKTYLIGDIFH